MDWTGAVEFLKQAQELQPVGILLLVLGAILVGLHYLIKNLLGYLEKSNARRAAAEAEQLAHERKIQEEQRAYERKREEEQRQWDRQFQSTKEANQQEYRLGHTELLGKMAEGQAIIQGGLSTMSRNQEAQTSLMERLVRQSDEQKVTLNDLARDIRNRS